ncbi:MAG: TIGR03032 family protein [Litoreibacter sp.]|uniref:TIGR03032 family protein n=1 Tax=Litoreibacter sp. TaxID=1969459 RepID=UPI003297113B
MADATSIDQVAEKEEKQSTVEFSVSGGLHARLRGLNASFALTSYQSNILYMIGRNSNAGINIHQSVMPRPMGISANQKGEDPVGMTMTAGFQIMRLENVLVGDQLANKKFDKCFAPRITYVTGGLDAHDVGLDQTGRPVFVNTRFNCLCVPSEKHSFEEIWRPPFITEIVDEDRCHLNGLAMENGDPRYATAVSKSNTIDGWRDKRGNGGVVIDIKTNKIVCEGLSMPHSPRMHNGELWLLNSGKGELGVVVFDKKGKGRFEPRAFCPGFLRGLSFLGELAFVGLSKPRYKRFEGLELDQKLADADSEPWCGVQIIDLSKGSCVDWFRIDGNVSEIYDVEVIPETFCPMAVGPNSDEVRSLITYEGMRVAKS